jgi:hypothetical protein
VFSVLLLLFFRPHGEKRATKVEAQAECWRAFYQALDQSVLQGYDVLLEGTLPPNQLADSLAQALRARREH